MDVCSSNYCAIESKKVQKLKEDLATLKREQAALALAEKHVDISDDDEGDEEDDVEDDEPDHDAITQQVEDEIEKQKQEQSKPKHKPVRKQYSCLDNSSHIPSVYVCTTDARGAC